MLFKNIFKNFGKFPEKIATVRCQYYKQFFEWADSGLFLGLFLSFPNDTIQI